MGTQNQDQGKQGNDNRSNQQQGANNPGTRQPGQDQRMHERAQHPRARTGRRGRQHQQGAKSGRHQGTVRVRVPPAGATRPR